MTAWLGWIWSGECEGLVRGEGVDEEGGGEGGGERGRDEGECREGEGDTGERRSGEEIKDCYQGASVERVVADVDPRNEASLGVLKRFGFREVGRAEVCPFSLIFGPLPCLFPTFPHNTTSFGLFISLFFFSSDIHRPMYLYIVEYCTQTQAQGPLTLTIWIFAENVRDAFRLVR